MSPVRRSGSAARPQPEVLRGSLFTLRRRCGTPTCRCADGEGHASPALAYPAGGRTKTLTLTEQEAVEVAAALARYAQAKADLDEQAAAGLTALLARVAARRPLGYPVTDEVDATNGQDRLYFQHGMIETVNGVATVYLN